MILSGHIIIKNAIKLDYPFLEACQSALEICDELVIVCDTQDDDGTMELVWDLMRRESPGRVQVASWDWWNPQRTYWALADATNIAIQLCKGVYHLQIQADEVLGGDVEILRDIAREDEADVVEIGHLHFWRDFSSIIPGEHLASRVRMARRSMYPRIQSWKDAATLVDMRYDPPDTRMNDRRRINFRSVVDQVQLFHYGHMRDPAAFQAKQRAMTELCFGTPGEEDPKVWQPIIDHLNASAVPFTGAHPACALRWIDRHPKWKV